MYVLLTVGSQYYNATLYTFPSYEAAFNYARYHGIGWYYVEKVCDPVEVK